MHELEHLVQRRRPLAVDEPKRGRDRCRVDVTMPFDICARRGQASPNAAFRVEVEHADVVSDLVLLMKILAQQVAAAVDETRLDSPRLCLTDRLL